MTQLCYKLNASIPLDPSTGCGVSFFDTKFRVGLNEKLLCLCLSGGQEDADHILNIESHINILERSRSIASNAVKA